jgi:type VI secretion system protein VasD
MVNDSQAKLRTINRTAFRRLRAIELNLARCQPRARLIPLNGRWTLTNSKGTPMKAIRRGLYAMILCTLAGCAGDGLGSVTGAALEATGLRKAPELPDAQKPARNVSIRLHAADKLNVDAQGRPLALVARLYKLRQNIAFEQAPYATFLSADAEKAALGADLLEVKEITLVPGQRYEATEKVSREAAFIGVVALFRSPAPQRWRLAFSAPEAERAGLTVGLHACALSVGTGALATVRDVIMLSSVHCQ